MLRHLVSHYWGVDCFGDLLRTMDSEYLYELVFSSTNWERRVVTIPGEDEADFGNWQVN